VQVRFKKGDKVQRIQGNYKRMVVGDTDTVIDTGGAIALQNFGAGHDRMNLKKIESAGPQKEKTMESYISKTFEKTDDALLVEKHVCFNSNTVRELIFADHKVAILKEAKRLEEESKKK